MYNLKILTIYTRKTIELKTVGTSGMANLTESELGTAQPQLVYPFAEYLKCFLFLNWVLGKNCYFRTLIVLCKYKDNLVTSQLLKLYVRTRV